MRSKSVIGAYILIGLGIIFLLSNLGWLPPIHLLMAQWWPLILIIVGILVLIRRSPGKKPQIVS
jgi:cell wall-active antibiotic response 4TMS protein YvqF